ncbi:MAG: cytochrome c3 family protein [Acidobacteriota bacterium]
MRISALISGVGLFVLGLTMSCGSIVKAQPRSAAAATTKEFVGSQVCEMCHKSIYDRWKETRMANILQDPKAKPGVILGDFSTPNPLVTFKKEDIVFTYGSKWKQRYFTKIGDDYFVFGAQWDIRNKMWRPYYVREGTDWWVPHYPKEQMKRPTGPLCDGCHSTNYNYKTKTVTEWNVGCEKCHGPGSEHVKQPIKANIVNPARLDYVRANDVCIQCHSQGQPVVNPIEGQYVDSPVGFLPGERLGDYWNLEEHHLGEETFTHWPDASAHKNRMQGNDFVTSVMYTRGVKCFSCHDIHGTAYSADIIKPGNGLCLHCHGPLSPLGPRGSLEEHTQHKADSGGSQCVACHMPEIAKTIGDVNVRSHTFRFISPAMTEKYKIPNPCTSCHADKTNEWALEELEKWPHVSPWRIKQ